jgi:peptidyl-tRNA hydrolase
MDSVNRSLAMYVLVNSDLKMSPGKIAAQVAHVAEKMAVEMVTEMYEEAGTYKHLLFKQYLKHGHKKVILTATTKEMTELMHHTDARHIIDEGYTEVPPDSLTVVAFFPHFSVTEDATMFKKFRLL